MCDQGVIAPPLQVHLETDSLIVVYVHIMPRSAVVAPGQRVKAGDELCRAGDIGFAPEPHLHMEVHSCGDLFGPSIPFAFSAGAGLPSFVPCAEKWYSQDGECDEPDEPAVAS